MRGTSTHGHTNHETRGAKKRFLTDSKSKKRGIESGKATREPQNRRFCWWSRESDSISVAAEEQDQAIPDPTERVRSKSPNPKGAKTSAERTDNTKPLPVIAIHTSIDGKQRRGRAKTKPQLPRRCFIRIYIYIYGLWKDGSINLNRPRLRL